MQAFLAEVLPGLAEPARLMAGEMIATALSEVGERISEQSHADAERPARADALADMLCAYLDHLRGTEPLTVA